MAYVDLQKCVDCEHYCRVCNECCKGVPDHQDCMFRCWTPSRAHELEQVAREMYSFIAISETLSGLTLRGQRKPTDKIMSLASFREQLESLGVNVDD